MAKSIARGKALLAKLKADPQVRDAEALAAYLGRKKAARGGGGGKVKSVLDPDERITTAGDMTEKQASYLKSLLGKGKPGAFDGDLESYPKKRDYKNQVLGYAVKLNTPTPKSKAEASRTIDELKDGPRLDLADLGEGGDMEEDPEDYTDLQLKVGRALAKRYDKDLSGLGPAMKKRMGHLTKEEQAMLRDSLPGVNDMFRKRVLNPLLVV